MLFPAVMAGCTYVSYPLVLGYGESPPTRLPCLGFLGTRMIE